MNDNRIMKLDERTASKIAAGEVVERPAMVIKELVENAIDAGATQISVEIKKGGKSFIKVSDNGNGIHYDDLPLVFERHATSKIRSIEDLYLTASLGFRGEALASICAVASVELITLRVGETVGRRVEAAGGKILKISEIGTTQGTTILVKDLFFNTPARLKFLKSDSAEGRSITELMGYLALSHPEVMFKYTSDDKLVFHTQGKGSLMNAIFAVFDQGMVKGLYEISDKADGLTLNGYISRFDYTKGSRAYQLVFVNGRYVKSDLVKEVIQMAYKPYMMHNRYPVCVLFLEIPPSEIDVNIHPAKTEIKFHEDGAVKQFIYSALKKAFNLYDQVPKVTFKEKEVFVMKTAPTEAEKMTQLSMNAGKGVKSGAKNHIIGDSNSNSDLEDAIKGNITVDDGNDIESKIKDGFKSESIGRDGDQVNDRDKNQDQNIAQNLDRDQDRNRDQNRDQGQDGDQVKIQDRSKDHDQEKDQAKDTTVVESNQYADNAIIKDNNDSLVHESKHQMNRPYPSHSMAYEKIESTGRSNSIPKQFDFSSLTSFATSALEESGVVLDAPIALENEFEDRHTIYDDLRYVGVFNNTYLLYEKDKSLYLIDQHAAHEKILFEQFMAAFERGDIQSQLLLIPEVLSFSKLEMTRFDEVSPLLHDMGFAVEVFGDDGVVMREIPTLFSLSQGRELVQAIFENARDHVDDRMRYQIAEKACKAAIKAHDAIHSDEEAALIESLKGLQSPYTCPHGRPIIISFSLTEIEKKFKRIL